MKTSHKKNRPFDFKLIDLVEPYPVLYQRQLGLSTYKYMKAKTEIWKEIAAQMGKDVQFCINRWGNLRCQFTKELRYCRYLCPKMGTLKNSTWPYLERLKFLESTVQVNKPKRNNNQKFQEDEQFLDNLYDDNSNSEEILESNVDPDSDPETELPKESINTNEACNFVSNNVLVSQTDARIANVQKISTLLEGIDNENRVRVERRIMAFLCKCQLRALMNKDVDDLFV